MDKGLISACEVVFVAIGPLLKRGFRKTQGFTEKRAATFRKRQDKIVGIKFADFVL